jgi:hypothetical protein
MNAVRGGRGNTGLESNHQVGGRRGFARGKAAGSLHKRWVGALVGASPARSGIQGRDEREGKRQ